jgi:hypothetical protein
MRERIVVYSTPLLFYGEPYNSMGAHRNNIFEGLEVNLIPHSAPESILPREIKEASPTASMANLG